MRQDRMRGGERRRDDMRDVREEERRWVEMKLNKRRRIERRHEMKKEERRIDKEMREDEMRQYVMRGEDMK